MKSRLFGLAARWSKSARFAPAALIVLALLAAAQGQESGAKVENLPAQRPAWLEGYRFRYALRVAGDPAAQNPRTIIARLPTGGWLKSDGSDVAVQTAAGRVIPAAVLSHDPMGETIIQFERSGDDKWYWAYGGNPAAATARAEGLAEGLTVEVREWVGDDLQSWTKVVEGLRKSENVIGNAVVAEVIQNSNPAWPSMPRQFASSYRGYLNIRTAGTYRFLINAEDASFLFIDGLKVFERPGENGRLSGRVVNEKIGTAIDLAEGVHPFEVHHVIGNKPQSGGYCAMLWLPPGAKSWAYVPAGAIVHPMLGTIANVEGRSAPAAVFDCGIDDTISSSGVTLFLTRFAAQGAAAAGPLTWDFGDGTTATGRSVTHVYFKEGVYTVRLQSSAGSPAFVRRVCVWPVPGTTNPLSLSRAVAALAATDWRKLEAQKINQMFEFLLICEQPERWPLVEAVARRLLSQGETDMELRALATTSLMEALAQQGRGREALKLGDAALKDFVKVAALLVRVKLQTAWIYHHHLRELEEASKRYQAIIEEHRRLEVPEVRLAAIRLGDLSTESGDLARAGEAYRLAGTLGGEAFRSTAASDAITRGAMLRVAEQKLKSGDVRQTRRLLEKIELDYPEQKLEGLYRFLRAEADRAGGRYEEALDNYQVLLKLTQWAGYRDRALFGMADGYYRLGDYPKALEWLASLEESFPAFYEKQKLAAYQRMIEGRLARQRAATQAAGGDKAATGFFPGLCTGFEIAEPSESPWRMASIVPGLGLMGAHVGLIESGASGPALYIQRLRNITSNGYYWVEVWCRQTRGPFGVNPQLVAWLYGSGADVDAAGTGTVVMDRSYGQWRRLGMMLKAPVTQDGRVELSLRQFYGATEVDAISVLPVSDRQHDAMANFVEGTTTP